MENKSRWGQSHDEHAHISATSHVAINPLTWSSFVIQVGDEFCTIHSVNDLVSLTHVLAQVSWFLLSRGMLVLQESFLTVWMFFNLITFWMILCSWSWSMYPGCSSAFTWLQTKTVRNQKNGESARYLSPHTPWFICNASCDFNIFMYISSVVFLSTYDGRSSLAPESYKWYFGKYFWHAGLQ